MVKKIKRVRTCVGAFGNERDAVTKSNDLIIKILKYKRGSFGIHKKDRRLLCTLLI